MQFEQIEWAPECFKSSEMGEVLVQWNLDKSLEIFRFRFIGGALHTTEDYFDVVLQFLKHSSSYGVTGVNGTFPDELLKHFDSKNVDQLSLTLLSMDIFNKLESSGSAKFIYINSFVIILL